MKRAAVLLGVLLGLWLVAPPLSAQLNRIAVGQINCLANTLVAGSSSGRSTCSTGPTITGTLTTAGLLSNGSVFVTGTGRGFGVGNIGVFNNTPTISSGFGSSPSIVSSNGTATFRVDVGTGGAATSGVIGMATATAGWNCQVIDKDTNVVTRETASTTATVTVTAASAWTASDQLIFNCWAF